MTFSFRSSVVMCIGGHTFMDVTGFVFPTVSQGPWLIERMQTHLTAALAAERPSDLPTSWANLPSPSPSPSPTSTISTPTSFVSMTLPLPRRTTSVTHRQLVSLPPPGRDSPPGFTCCCMIDGYHVTAHAYEDIGTPPISIFCSVLHGQ